MHFDKPLVKYMKKVLKEDKENNRFYSSKSSCIIMKMSDTEGTEDRYLRGYYIKKEPCRGTIFVTDRKQKSMVFAVLSAQFSSVAQSCLTLCNPMNRSRPGLPVYHHLPEFTQTHVHQVGDAIQPSHPLSSPFPPAPNLSQHQGLFQWVNSSDEVAKVLEFQLWICISQSSFSGIFHAIQGHDKIS